MYVPARLQTLLIDTCADDLHLSKRNVVSLDRLVSVVHEKGVVHVSVVCLYYTDSVLRSPNSVLLHLFVFTRGHFSPFITFSPVILLSPKDLILSLYSRLSHTVLLLPEAWLAPQLVPSASSSVIYSGAHFICKWNSSLILSPF